MKQKMLSVSLFIGLLLCINQTAYAGETVVNQTKLQFLFTQVYELFNMNPVSGGINIGTQMILKSDEDTSVDQVTIADELGSREVRKGSELLVDESEVIEPVYVDQLEVPLDPQVVDATVTKMNDEMVVIQEEIKQQAIEEAEKEAQIPVFENYRQTFYAVTDGEVKVGYGLTYQDSLIKSIDNVMHYYDDEYEWLPVVAIDIDEVLAGGLDKRGVPNYYGTVLEIEYPNGVCQNAVVLDACGACSWDERVDLWLYSPDYKLDIEGIKYKVIRNGFEG